MLRHASPAGLSSRRLESDQQDGGKQPRRRWSGAIFQEEVERERCTKDGRKQGDGVNDTNGCPRRICIKAAWHTVRGPGRRREVTASGGPEARASSVRSVAGVALGKHVILAMPRHQRRQWRQQCHQDDGRGNLLSMLFRCSHESQEAAVQFKLYHIVRLS